MPTNLPKKEFIEGKKKLKNDYNFTKWVLFWKGKNFLYKDTFFSYLWLRNVHTEEYPIDFGYGNYNTIIRVKILSVRSSKFILGSIFDNQGKLLSLPEYKKPKRLKNVGLWLNNNYLTKGDLYKTLGQTFYPTPYIRNELDDTYYYKKIVNVKDKPVCFLIPLQVFNDFFFFSHSTKLNNLIISNGISDCVKCIGKQDVSGEKTGMISQNRLEIKKSQALYYGRYFFTEKNVGTEALNELRTNHLIKIQNGERKVYFKSKIPFHFDIKFNILGQFIKDDIFIGYRIAGIESLNNTPFFDVDKVVVSVINDTRSSMKYEGNNVEKYNKLKNELLGIKENNENHFSDQSSELLNIIEEEPKTYSFYQLPKNEVFPKDSNKNKYVLDKIIRGKKYTGGTSNLYGISEESNVVKTDTEITLFDLIEWNELIIETLIQICSEKKYKGYFIKLNSEIIETPYEKYDKKKNFNLLTTPPNGTNSYFKFLLFRIIINDKSYYYFDKGVGSYSAFFSDTNHSQIEKNRLNLFIKKMINDYNLKWSPAYRNEVLKPYGFIIYQPIEHKIENLKKRLLKRLHYS